MNKDFDARLVKEFPNLYRNRNGSVMETCMCWGFETGDGWNEIIYKLSSQLEALILQIPAEERDSYCASQVKEKFGTLRFYMENSTEEMDNLISAAEDKSATTCEVCGESGELQRKGWWKTRCQTHSK